IDQIIKIAKMKKDSLMANSLKAALLEISGTALSMGVKVEGMNPKEFQQKLREGAYDERIAKEEW
ncbi:MAG: 50S ribosomal protein L11, partial [Nanoarchaeota archaeon]